MVLTEETIPSIESCFNKEMLAFVHYPGDGAARCFTYPQFLIERDRITLLEHSAFPDVGCLPATLGRTSNSEMRSRFGSIVVMRLNMDEVPQANRYYESEGHRYCSIISPSRAKGESAVEFEPLSNHSLSVSLMQLIEVQEVVDFSKPLSSPVHLMSGQHIPLTNLVVVSQTNSNGDACCFGPFEYNCTPEGAITLSASTSNDLYISSLANPAFDCMIPLQDNQGSKIATFIDAAEFASLAKGGSTIDWLSDQTLLDALGRISRKGDTALTKGQMRTLKTDIQKASSEQAGISLTESRRERMLGLLSSYESWISLPNEIKDDAIANADPAQLAEYVLSNEHFKPFYDKVIENSQVKAEVEREKTLLRSGIDALRKTHDQAKNDLAAVQAELEEYRTNAKEKKRTFEEGLAAQVQEAQTEKAQLEKSISSLQETKSQLERSKDALLTQISESISSMTNEVVLSKSILESELVRQVIETMKPNEAPGASKPQPAMTTLLPANESALIQDDLEPKDVLARISAFVNDTAGRDVEWNDLANIMICLTQGYVVTFAGLPGTGKTSLVNILAAALGLKNSKARRFAEVPVEKGWTSYKDFIGYYNPFTKTLEKASPIAYDAFAQLDAEQALGLAPSSVAPYMILLDEANLSSIEHYWSPFLRACDASESAAWPLSLGGDSTFSVPGYLRFVATVNFDHTTEELSPRFLDRSWVIMLEASELEDDDVESSFNENDWIDLPAFSQKALQNAFGKREGDMLDANLSAKLKEVLDICSKHKHPVSPRSQRMIRSYAITATELMDRSFTRAAYAPIDFAVTQKVLPQLSGTEERLGGLLEDLSAVSGLPLTKARVDHMLEAGNDSGYYQYFA